MARLNRGQRRSFTLIQRRHELIPPKELSADPGSYAVTGVAASTVRGYVLDAQPGAYTVTGTAATTVRAFPLDAQPGAYTITGTAATTVRASVVDAQPGAYAITGVAATLPKEFPLNAQPGAYTITGTAASTVRGYVLDAQPGAYALTGVDATLDYVTLTPDRRPALQFDQVALQRAQLRRWRRRTVAPILSRHKDQPAAPGAYEINAQPGSYAISGVEAEFVLMTLVLASVARLFALDTRPLVRRRLRAGSVTIKRKPDTAAVAYSLDAQPGSYAVGGVAADLVKTGSYILDAQPGAFNVTGTAATPLATRLINAAPTSYVITGTAALTAKDRSLNAAPATFAVTGVAATTLPTRSVVASPGTYTITGSPADVLFSGLQVPATGRLLDYETAEGDLQDAPVLVGALRDYPV